MSKNLNLSEGKVASTLLKFTVPILFSLVLQVTYGSVDLLIVGRFAEAGDLSGVTIGSELMFTITAFCTGLSMGTTILIGRYIGANQKDMVSKVIGNSIVIFFVFAALVTAGILLGSNVIIALMQTPAESLLPTKNYLFFSGIGAVFIVSYNVLGSIFRGVGDSSTPLIAVAIACVINILLDLLFVAYFDMGAGGAAVATMLAQGFSVLLSLLLLRRRALPFSLTAKDLAPKAPLVKEIIALGLPAALQTLLTRISFMSITAILNTFGVVVSAAVGIVGKITGIIMLVPGAFMQAMSAFTAQNHGAGRLDRAKQGLKYSILISLGVSLCAAYVSIFHGTLLVGIFTSDAAIIEQAQLYLKIYAVDTMLVAVLFSMVGFYNGYGKTRFTMLQSLSGAFLVRIPLTFFLSRLPNTNLLITGIGVLVATSAQILICVVYYSIHFRQKRPQ